MGIEIDGETPFYEADSIELPRRWANSTEVKTDDSGNQYIPMQEELALFSQIALYDETGAQVYPFMFYLEKGEHKLKINFVISEPPDPSGTHRSQP